MTSPDEQMSLREAAPVPAYTDAETVEPRTGTRQLLGLAVIALVVVGALVVSSLSRSDPSRSPEPVAGSPSSGAGGTGTFTARDALARAVLQRQEKVLGAGTAQAYLRTWDAKFAAARHRAAAVYANLDALHARLRSTRYVAADIGGVSVHQQRRLGGAAWTAEVDLSWRLRGFDHRDARATLRYTFVQRAGDAYVVDISAAPGAPLPVWLLGPLVVRRSAHTLVAATTAADAAQLDRQLRQAAVDVASVVSDWRGGLVAYVPADEPQMEALLATTPGAYSNIAAVTTAVDGSHDPNAPVAIVVNPVVFGRLGHVGARVVITHESTHVVTGATAVDLPLWVAEGFADYVGVGSVDVPMSVAAGAVVRDIRQHGLPDALPSNSDFGSAQGNLEVYYEQAWLAARVIARTYGEDRLVAFYERVVAQPDNVAEALRTTLETTRSALTAEWRNYLRAVSSAA